MSSVLIPRLSEYDSLDNYLDLKCFLFVFKLAYQILLYVYQQCCFLCLIYLRKDIGEGKQKL